MKEMKFLFTRNFQYLFFTNADVGELPSLNILLLRSARESRQKGEKRAQETDNETEINSNSIC